MAARSGGPLDTGQGIQLVILSWSAGRATVNRRVGYLLACEQGFGRQLLQVRVSRATVSTRERNVA
jgi:hypothetical protein